ncbi:UDP-N-acetylmuramate dehydrogenase [Candidatus Babeliales bacterium]|nr:UDP-N-acetylmuramate dehydrogenase [Candidatus Babeliales bacterium]
MNLKKTKAKRNIDLNSFTTFGIGGRAKYFFLIRNCFELSALAEETEGQFYLLGNGSNLLIKDGLITKPVVKLVDQFESIESRGETLEVGSSTLLSFLIKYCLNNKLSGLENLAGIPATVGGMLSTAASSFGTSIFDFLEKVEVMEKDTGKIYEIKKDKIDYGYRYSSLYDKLIIKGYFKFVKSKDEMRERIKSVVKKRIALQDFSFPSCGSVFKNPYPKAAGALIEQVGLKGKCKGDVKISDKHANFILNLGKGTYQQANYLIQHIKDTVYEKKGIILEEEIQKWN